MENNDRLVKGYADDAGADVLLTEPVYFEPHSTTVVDLKIKAHIPVREAGFLFARTSAAKRGLIVAPCPIDPNYSGSVSAVVHNVSDSLVTYGVGEAFCQIVVLQFTPVKAGKVKKEGVRTDGAFGSTDKR